MVVCPECWRQEVARLQCADDLVHPAVVVAVVMADRDEVERRDPLPLENARGRRSWSGPASIRAVLPSGERIRIESPWPTSRISIVAGLPPAAARTTAPRADRRRRQ